MKIDNVLVVHKRSEYEHYSQEERDPRFLQLLGEDHFTVHDLRKKHLEHREAVERVGAALEQLRITARFVLRPEFRDTHGYDLVVALGGDGTFLDVSHHVRDVPMLGVNSTPSTSVGAYCGATSRTFLEIITAIRQGRLEPTSLARLSLVLNGHPIIEPVLNEALIAAQTPADTSRYVLEVLRKKEHQKSSGLYISTASGSTAVTRAAGGKPLPWASKVVQFVVREPYHEPGSKYTLLRGQVPPKSGMRVHSKMRNGMIYVDGPLVRFRFDFGDELVISPDSVPLRVFGIGGGAPKPSRAATGPVARKTAPVTKPAIKPATASAAKRPVAALKKAKKSATPKRAAKAAKPAKAAKAKKSERPVKAAKGKKLKKGKR